MIINCEWCRSDFKAIQRRRFCSQECARLARSGYSNPEVFWSKTIKRENGCIEWRGPFAHNGYGRTYLANKKRCAAHRLAWILSVGPIPEGLFVLHKCDNPKCCGVDHLFLGTLQENSDDMMRKGRHRTNNPGGLNSKGSKFTADQVISIRRLIDSGEPKLRIAKQYGVGWTTIQKLYTRKTYSDVV